MLTHTDLKKGTQFIYENQPWEVVDSLLVKMTQRRPVVQTKIKSLIKVALKVKEAAPGVKGDRAQGGTKEAVLETGAVIQVPLFIEEGDVIEINTELGEYVKRASE